MRTHCHPTPPRCSCCRSVSPALIMRVMPEFIVRLVVTAMLGRFTKTEKVPARLVTLSSFIGE